MQVSIDHDVSQLVAIDKKIDKSESAGLRARWEFGKLMLAARNGKGRLPDGYMAKLETATGKRSSELGYRQQFAKTYPTEDELSNALERYKSWREVIQSFAEEGGGSSTPPQLSPARAAERLEKGAANIYELKGRVVDMKPGDLERLQGAAVTMRNAAQEFIDEVQLFDSRK